MDVGTFYRDEIIAKSLKVGDRGTNLVIGFAEENSSGEIESFGMKLLLPKVTPVTPVAAALTVGGVTFTADVAGTDAEKWSIALIDPGEADQALSIEVDEETFEINISLATDSAGDITTTATALVTAFNGVDELDGVITASGSGATPLTAAVAAHLDGGVNGTLGAKGEVVFDDSYLYVSVDESTVSVSNWKKVAIA
jgi:hypothetical protein